MENDGTVTATSLVSVTLQEGLNGYTGCEDTYLNGYSTTYAVMNYGGATNLRLWKGTSSGTTNRHSLVKFDLSSIPSGATITSAHLELYCYAFVYPSDSGRVYVRRVTRSWVEGASDGASGVAGATWYEWDYYDHATTSQNDWTTYGGDFGTDLTNQTTTVSSWSSFDVTSAVADMVANPSGNYGFGLVPGGTTNCNAISFYSSEYTGDTSLRPKLVIEYTTSGN